jgi:uncharacterized membrane protein YgcG
MRKTIFCLACILTLAFLGLLPAAGLGQSLDQLLVVDDAKVFGNRVAEVEAAANKLVSQGADVRVRTILTYEAAANLDQYEAQLEQQSPSWLGQDGDRKNNLIVLIISSQERQTGLYYGAYWDDIIGDKWLTIQTDIMNPLFRDGDYTRGAIRGLEEIRQVIAGNGQSQSEPQTGTGQSKGWIIPVIIVVIVSSIIGLFLFMNYRKRRTKRLAARQKAMLLKQAAASGINELIEAIQMLEIKVDVMADKVTPDEASPLRKGLEKARGLTNQSAETYSELSHSAGDPENPRLEESQLAVIEAEYQKIVDNLRQARESIKGVEEGITGIQQAVDSFPVKVAEVNTAIEDALRKQDELKGTGLKTTYPAELVAKGRNTLEQAQDLVSKKRIREGMKYVSLAGDQIKQAIQATEELPQKKLEAEAAIPALSSRIEQVKETIEKGGDTFERLSQEYAESNWESVRGNGTEAENRVNWALDALNDALAATGMEQQEWHKALELVEKGNTWLTEAESLIKSIAELAVNLIAARRDAPDEINAAQADVAKAWEYINRYDEDIRESLEDDLLAAERKNELAKEELRQERPDYFRVCKLARESNEAADRILIQARDEHEAAERLRAKAASSRRDASAKVSIARKYVEDHHPVVRSKARNYLISAVEALRQADAATDVNAQISLALKAESAAEQAYSLAQKDVSSTTMNTPGISIPPIFFPTGGTPSWGSRRSSSSGSSSTIRRGGGGSSGWGSRGGSIGRGGSRGGGSTGW